MISIAAMGLVSTIVVLVFAISEILFWQQKKGVGVVFCRTASWAYHVNASMQNYLLVSLSCSDSLHNNQTKSCTSENAGIAVALVLVDIPSLVVSIGALIATLYSL